MKKILTIAAFMAFSFVASAQQDNIDQLQQQPPRETQAEVERAARRDANKEEADKKQQEAEQKEAEIRRKEAELRDAEIKKDEENKGKVKSKSK